jgi:Flp pilus assembly protein TadD
MGLALVAAEQPEEALGRFSNALRLRPEYAEAHNDLGVALVKTSRLLEAIKHFEQAARLQPGLADAQYNLEVARAMRQAAASRHGAGLTEPTSGSAAPQRDPPLSR